MKEDLCINLLLLRIFPLYLLKPRTRVSYILQNGLLERKNEKSIIFLCWVISCNTSTWRLPPLLLFNMPVTMRKGQDDRQAFWPSIGWSMSHFTKFSLSRALFSCLELGKHFQPQVKMQELERGGSQLHQMSMVSNLGFCSMFLEIYAWDQVCLESPNKTRGNPRFRSL